jgi:hypothetical protein
MVNFTEKGVTPWETKAEKRIKIKPKSRKPANRPKRIRIKRNNGDLLSADVVGVV